MARSLIVLFLAAAIAGAAQVKAPPVAAAPTGTPPSFAFVSKVDKDKETVTLRQPVEVPVTTIREVIVNVEVNGVVRPEKRKVEVVEMKLEHRDTVYPLKNATATTVGGDKVSKEELWKRLTENKMILVTWTDGVDPAYQTVLQKDVLVVRFPMEALKGGAGPGTAPLPFDPPPPMPRPMPKELPPPPPAVDRPRQ